MPLWIQEGVLRPTRIAPKDGVSVDDIGVVTRSNGHILNANSYPCYLWAAAPNFGFSVAKRYLIMLSV